MAANALTTTLPLTTKFKLLTENFATVDVEVALAGSSQSLKPGADINGNATISVAGGTAYNIPGPLAGNITIHLSVAGPPRDNQQIQLNRTDTSGFTVTVVNDGPLGGNLLVMPPATKLSAGFSFAAGDWYPGGNADLQ